jgi:uncharacterized protein YjeT (DUF2065 family)
MDTLAPSEFRQILVDLIDFGKNRLLPALVLAVVVGCVVLWFRRGKKRE